MQELHRRSLAAARGTQVPLLGGGGTAGACIAAGLVDEFVLAVHAVLSGSDVRLVGTMARTWR